MEMVESFNYMCAVGSGVEDRKKSRMILTEILTCWLRTTTDRVTESVEWCIQIVIERLPLTKSIGLTWMQMNYT